MYPFIRLAANLVRHRSAPPLSLLGEHKSVHMVWPWDIDPFMELNNGRTLTLNDLGRFLLFRRMGALEAMRRLGWTGTVAGVSVRYRRRVRMFERYELRSRVTCWDARFVYVEQSMWRKGECTSHVLLRMALTDRGGIVPTDKVARALGAPAESPPFPPWIAAWIAAEAQRPWPPMQRAVSVSGPVEAPAKAG